MPKAKPVSLHPLTFHEALKALVRAKPKAKSRGANITKRNKRSAQSHQRLTADIATNTGSHQAFVSPDFPITLKRIRFSAC